MNEEIVFEMKEKEDALFYLKELILISQMKLDRMKDYIKEMKNIIEEKEEEGKIKSRIYENYNDKMAACSNYIKNMYLSNDKLDISYYKFRNDILNSDIDVSLEDVDFKLIKTELDQIFDLKGNWKLRLDKRALDVTLNAFNEMKSTNPYISLIDENGNLPVFYYEYYKIDIFKELYQNSKDFYDYASTFKQKMKRDYSKILGKSLRINRTYNNYRQY